MQKNTEISERLSEMLELIGSNPNSFAKKLEYPRAQTIYDIINGKSAPSYDFFKRFQISEYSEIINIDWLLTGRGEALINKKAFDKNGHLNGHLNSHLSPNSEDLSVTLASRMECENSQHLSMYKESEAEEKQPRQDNSSNELIKHLIEQLNEKSEEIGALRQEVLFLKDQLAQSAEDALNVQGARA